MNSSTFAIDAGGVGDHPERDERDHRDGHAADVEAHRDLEHRPEVDAVDRLAVAAGGSAPARARPPAARAAVAAPGVRPRPRSAAGAPVAVPAVARRRTPGSAAGSPSVRSAIAVLAVLRCSAGPTARGPAGRGERSVARSRPRSVVGLEHRRHGDSPSRRRPSRATRTPVASRPCDEISLTSIRMILPAEENTSISSSGATVNAATTAPREAVIFMPRTP